MATQSDSPAEFLIDRSLGKSIAIGLRAEGLVVHTMSGIYGEKPGQLLADEVWLRDASLHNWAILTKDDAIRRRPAERDALIEASARVFCLTNRNPRGAEQTARFVANRDRILRQARKPGPYIYGVYANELKRLWPPTGGG